MQEIEEFYAGFTKPELYEILFEFRAAAVADFALFLTLLFGYIAAAYFVRDKISRTEAIFITALYSVAVFLIVWQLYVLFAGLLTVGYVLFGVYTPEYAFVSPAVCLAGWASSIWFMFRSRLTEQGDA